MKKIVSNNFYNNYTNVIKKLSKKDNNYNWINGNNFLGQNGTRKKFIRPIGLDKNFAKENLLLMKKILDKNNIFFYLVCGTLLGAVRDKDFIDDDNDTDICIFLKDLPKLVLCVPELMKNGLIPLRINEKEVSFVKNNEYIDIEFLNEETKFTNSFDKINFCGEEFNIPNNIDEYLTQCYGNWKVKSNNHTWVLPK
jgi:hypothetical protein